MQTIKIIVRTNSGRSEILGFDEGKNAVIVNVKAVPEKGKANAEVIKLFRKKYRKAASIIKGLKSKNKVVALS